MHRTSPEAAKLSTVLKTRPSLALILPPPRQLTGTLNRAPQMRLLTLWMSLWITPPARCYSKDILRGSFHRVFQTSGADTEKRRPVRTLGSSRT